MIVVKTMKLTNYDRSANVLRMDPCRPPAASAWIGGGAAGIGWAPASEGPPSAAIGFAIEAERK